MEKAIEITGTTQEELQKAIELVYMMFFETHREESQGVTAFKMFDKTTRDSYYEKDNIDSTPELHFYSHFETVIDANNFPTKMPVDVITNMSWEWLKTQEINYSIDTDGSYGRGWSLIAGNSWQYSDYPDIIIKFTTMIYGK